MDTLTDKGPLKVDMNMIVFKCDSICRTAYVCPCVHVLIDDGISICEILIDGHIEMMTNERT